MAERVEIEVEIDAQGEVSLKVKGMKGKGCADLARSFEQALGEVREHKQTSEYFAEATVTQTQHKS